MKYITVEQFKKASDEVQCKIMGWWIPSDGDLMYNLETKEREVFEPSYMDIDCVHSYCIPLLTVGQLMGFIEKITDSKMDIIYSYINGGYEILSGKYWFDEENDDLLQVLWNMLNEIIDNKIIKGDVRNEKM